jgi:hypothetical protein
MPPGRRSDGSIGPVGKRPRPSAPPKGVGPVTAGGGGRKGGCLSMVLTFVLAVALAVLS